MLSNPSELETWGTFRDPIVTPNVEVAPDGTLTADRIQDSLTQNGARIYSAQVPSEGGSYVFSCYLKAGTIKVAKIAIADGSGSSVRGFIEPTLSSQWQRFQVAIRNAPTTGTLRVEIYPGKFDRESGYVVAWGAQFEKGESATEFTGGSPTPPPSDPDPAPAVPGGLSASLQSGKVQVSWDANAEADLKGYLLQRSASGGTFSALSSPSQPGYLDGAVSAGTTYAYRVAAVDVNGNTSAYSSSVSVTIPTAATPPGAPSGLTGQWNGSAVQLKWTANTETDVVSYRVERGANSSTSFSALATTTTPAYGDAAVVRGNTYSYRVLAVNAAGLVSQPSAVISVAVPAPTTGALSVVDFGASPAAAGDDTSAIQAAFNAAASQGKDVYFPEGYYLLSQTVVFRANGRTIFGDGLAKSTVAGNTSSFNLLQLDRTQDVTVRDLRLEGSHVNTSDTANTGKAVECYATQRTRLLRLHAFGTGYIAFDNGGTFTTLEDSICEDYGRIGYLVNTGGIIRGCKFVCAPGWRFTSEMHGIYASAGKKQITIEDCEFVNAGIYAIQLWGSQTGVWTEDIVIQRNRFVGCPRVLVVAAGASGPSYRRVRFVGNTIQQTGEKSLQIGKFNGSTADGSELLIEGNVFEDAGPAYGIWLTPWAGSAPLTGVRIRGNEFRAPNRSSYNGMVNVSGASDVVIEENGFADIGHDGAKEIASDGIQITAGQDLRVRDNRFRFHPLAGQAREAAGIRVKAGAVRAVIEENRFTGNGGRNCLPVSVPPGSSEQIKLHGNQNEKASTAPK
jgi:hypothetical protein